MKNKIYPLLFSLVILFGIRTELAFTGPPDPSESKLLKVEGGGFSAELDKDGTTFSYAVTLGVKNPRRSEAFLVEAA